jgi:hypothetical protein
VLEVGKGRVLILAGENPVSHSSLPQRPRRSSHRDRRQEIHVHGCAAATRPSACLL